MGDYGKPRTACATCWHITGEYDDRVNEREASGDLFECPACQDITRHAIGLCDDCREDPCGECEHYPA